MGPNRAFKVFSKFEKVVAAYEVKAAANNDSKVEDLVTCSTYVKSTRFASLWNPKYV
jgi:hypothetical protein